MARPYGSKKNGWKYLTDYELDSFFETIEKKGKLRDEVMMKLILYLGLRAGEVTQIRINDLNPDSRGIYIKSLKGGRERNYSNIDGKLWKKLVRYLRKAEPKDKIFPITNQTVKNIFKRYSEMSGLRKDLSVHALRHSTAIAMARNNDSPVKIMLWLRHRSISSSQKYFEQIQFENQSLRMNSLMANWL